MISFLLIKKKKIFQLALILVSTSERMYQGLKLICHVHVYFWSSYKVVNNLRWYTWQYLGVKSPPFLHKVYVIDWNRFKKVLSCSDNLYEKFKLKLWPIRIKKKNWIYDLCFFSKRYVMQCFRWRFGGCPLSGDLYTP